MHGITVDPLITNLMVFVLAIFVGYHVVWHVTPALHTPLMSVTNAISSVIIVGAILAAGSGVIDRGSILGAVAVALVAINTFGGFLVTERMLEMFKKKERPNPPAGGQADNPPKRRPPQSKMLPRSPRADP